MDKITDRDQEVIFTNWTDKDFIGIWLDGPYKVSSSPVSYSPVKRLSHTIKAGKSYYLPFYKAEKFAREIADREYWTAFNEKLEAMRLEKGNERLERRQLESLVSNSNDIRLLDRQKMMDKCIEVSETDVERVEMKEVKLKEAVLERDRRGVEQAEKFGMPLASSASPGGIQVNQKAIKEEFEDIK